MSASNVNASRVDILWFAYGLWLGCALTSVLAVALAPWPIAVWPGMFGIVSSVIAWLRWREIAAAQNRTAP